MRATHRVLSIAFRWLKILIFQCRSTTYAVLFETATNLFDDGMVVQHDHIRRTDALEAFVRGTRSIALYKDKKALIEMSSGTPKNVPAST